jgi:thioredoxin reductase
MLTTLIDLCAWVLFSLHRSLRYLKSLAIDAKRDETLPQRTVVLVGLGFGNMALYWKLKSLKDVRVVAIDCRSFFEYSPSIPHCMSHPDLFDEITCDFQTLLGADFCQGIVEDIDLAGKEVIVTLPDQSKQAIAFDECVMGTGSSYANGIKLGPSSKSWMRRTDRKAHFYRIHKRASSHQHTYHILGGGFVAVEVAGELASLGGSVHLWRRRELLSPSPETERQRATAILQALGVQFHVGEPFPSATEEEEDANLEGHVSVMACCGANDSTLPDHSRPSDWHAGPSLWAVGDIIDRPGQKTAAMAMEDAEQVYRLLSGRANWHLHATAFLTQFNSSSGVGHFIVAGYTINIPHIWFLIPAMKHVVMRWIMYTLCDRIPFDGIHSSNE